MKNHLITYGILVLVFISYNLFFQIQDSKTNTAVNIILASILFLYIAFLAWTLIQKMGKKK